MSLVHIQQHVVMLAAQPRHFSQRRDIAVHAEYRLRDHKHLMPLGTLLRDYAPQMLHVVVAKPLERHAAKPHAVDD